MTEQVADKPLTDQYREINSLKMRYLVKLFANLIGFAISLVTQSIIPRSLGPKLYGNFCYLTNISSQIVGFFDMGTTQGFYTKISQRQKEFGLVAFYVVFALIVSAVVLLLVFVSQASSFHATLWPEQSTLFVYLAAVWAILTWHAQIINNVGDAYGQTVPIEKARVMQRFLGLFLIVMFVFYENLNLGSLFFCNLLTTVVFTCAMVWILDRGGTSFNQKRRLSKADIASYAKEFFQYSHPLFAYSVVALIVGVLDRWFLQTFSGSVQQGFFGISSQIAAVCFLFTSSMVSLIIREFSIAYAQKDLEQMAGLFRRYIPLFYGIAAFFSCFIALQAESVAYLFGGVKFHDAALPIGIMALCQIHQTYGMLSGAVFMASGQTRLYSKIGIIFNLIGLPVSYFLIAPAAQMGLNAGATGLAVKMMVVQFLGVNAHLYYNCRFLKLDFRRYLGHQFLAVFVFLTLSAFAVLVVDRVTTIRAGIAGRFLLSGMLYCLLVSIVLYFMPLLLGLYRQDIASITQLVLQKIGTKTDE